MKEYSLSPMARKIFGFFYKATFFLLVVYLVFFLAMVFSVVQGWLDQDNYILMPVSYVFGGLVLISAVFMAFYAIGYVFQLWEKGHREEALRGLVVLVLFNILAGYIWFYWSEVKGEEIRLKLL